MRLARRLARESRGDEAELVLRRATAADASPAAALELARLLQAQRRYGEAEVGWRGAAAVAPDDPGALQGLLRVLRLRHRYADAQAAIAAGLVRFGHPRPLVLEAARLAAQRESYPEAARWYHRTLALAGSAAEPLDELGRALLGQHRFAAARAVAERLVAGEPGRATWWESLARVAEEEGDLERARACWHELLDIDHGHLRARLALGRLLEEFGQAVEAEDSYRDLADAHPGATGPLYQLGRLALAQSDLAAAAGWLERVLALDPLDWSAAAALARTMAEQHRFAAARRKAGELLARLPDHLEAHLLLAWVEERAGKPEAAARALAGAATVFPQAFAPALRHGELLTRDGRTRAAREVLESAADVNPETLSLRLALADACFAVHDQAAAARHVEALVADYPLHREVKKRLARLEVLGRRFAAARRLWAEAARFDRRVAGPPLNLERLDERPIPPPAGEIRLFTRLRNEALRLPWLLRFYRGQGVDRFFVVDNGSDDGSRELLLREPDVHLFLTTDSYAVHGGGMRWLNDLLERHGAGAWCLTVDVDELFAYPHAERLGLRGLTDHLDRQGAQALRGFMLDMYAEDSLHRVAYAAGDDPLVACPCFDRSGYLERDHPDFPFRMVAGGLVSRYFYHRKQEGVYLHKVPLVRWQSGLRYTSSTHTLFPVPLAEESCLLLHLKYMADFVDRALVEARRKQYWQGAKRYTVFNRRLAGTPAVDFHCELTERFTSTRQLVELGLMTTSPALEALAAGLEPSTRLAGWRDDP